MKTSKPWVLSLAFIPLLFVLAAGCKKDGHKKPEVTTNEITGITQISAISGGKISFDGGNDITAKGVCWSRGNTPTITDNRTNEGVGAADFTSQITMLEPATTYYVRAYAKSSAGIAYGTVYQFTTLDPAQPHLTTKAVESITATSAVSGGNITEDGFANVIARGIVWNTAGSPSIENKLGMTVDGEGKGPFLSQMTALLPETSYFVRSYATNSEGTAYGDEIQFETLRGLPTVQTLPASLLRHNYAVCGGEVVHEGDIRVSIRGVVWSTSPNPSLDNHSTADGHGPGTFESTLTGLEPTTRYYYKAYAINAFGVAYGEEKIQETWPLPPWPCPETPTVTDIDGNTYNTVLIGNKCWMKENLKVTRYRNNTAIAYPGDNNQAWLNNNNGAYAWYGNDYGSKDTYGALYNWQAVNSSHGLCPDGWRIAHWRDWTDLTSYLGRQGFPNSWSNPGSAGNALKSCRQIGSALEGCNTNEHPRWESHNIHYGIDTYGFSALPGGYRTNDGEYRFIGYYGYWWTISENAPSTAYYYFISHYTGNVSASSFNRKNGLSVRCVKE